jgi:cytochrome c oxidase assembly protein subunit 15
VGGLAVRGDLHPFLVQSHFLLAMLSIGSGLVAVHRSRPEPTVSAASIGVTPVVTWTLAGFGALVAAALVTGTVVTGAGPHAGDETARRYGFDISSVAEIHSVTVWLAVAAFLVLVVVVRRDPTLFERLARNVSTWMFIAVVQGGIGYLQYFNDVPAVLVAAHVAGATALWVTTVQFMLSVREPLAAEAPSVPTVETDVDHRIAFEAARTV